MGNYNDLGCIIIFENVCPYPWLLFFFFNSVWVNIMLLYCFSAVSRPLDLWDHAYNATLFSPNFFTYHSSRHASHSHFAYRSAGERPGDQSWQMSMKPFDFWSAVKWEAALPIDLVEKWTPAWLHRIGSVTHSRMLHVDVQKAVCLLPVTRLWWNLHSLLSVDNRRGRTEQGYLIKLAITIMNMDIASAWRARG